MKLLKLISYLFLILFSLMLCACANTAKFEEKLATWIGHNERELISAWGVPDSVYVVSENEKFLTYIKSDSLILPGTAPTYTTNIIGRTTYTTTHGGTNPIMLNLHCKTTFTVKDEIIFDWSWKGNNCISP